MKDSDHFFEDDFVWEDFTSINTPIGEPSFPMSIGFSSGIVLAPQHSDSVKPDLNPQLPLCPKNPFNENGFLNTNFFQHLRISTHQISKPPMVTASRKSRAQGETELKELKRYVKLLNSSQSMDSGPSESDLRRNEIKAAPLFSWSVKQTASTVYNLNHSQYALLGHVLTSGTDSEDHELEPIFVNTDTPWSAFICGQQSSGKSYTLSCMLEGCLLDSNRLGKLPEPLTGIVFNYDSQAGDVCEAAYLCSAGIKVTVLVSPSNQEKMEKLYMRLPQAKKNLKVEPLYLKPEHLNTERMKRLMAFGDNESNPPLYLQVRDPDAPIYVLTTNFIQTVIKTLRQMALDTKGAALFNYDDFKHRLAEENFTKDQCGPLDLRLNLLESFMEGNFVDGPFQSAKGLEAKGPGKKDKAPRKTKNIKTGGPEILAGNRGELKIIDLTDPVIDSDSACVLFDICLAIFLETTKRGKVVALDEAHNVSHQCY
jgi:hypothetical protein